METEPSSETFLNVLKTTGATYQMIVHFIVNAERVSDLRES
jgi:hypothetical protein